ncbi:MAG: hypothetical protein AAB610_02545 [Patescibacteria group bacterium]
MNDYIENLKQKPEHVRKRFAFMVAFSFTFIVFAGWMASYGLKSSPVLADKDSTVDAPVSTLTASVKGAYEDVKNIIFGSNKVEYSGDFIEVTGGKR